MKLSYQHNDFGPKVTCVDDNEYDGAEDAGTQLIGTGDTEEAAKKDFMDQWVARECDRDIHNAVEVGQSWDRLIAGLLGVKP